MEAAVGPGEVVARLAGGGLPALGASLPHGLLGVALPGVLLGRLADRYSDRIEAINIQFPLAEPRARERARRKKR